MTTYFIQAFIYLLAAVVTVPLAKRAGLGSVLGYLIAGVLIGPITGLVGSETASIQHFAEFGVVMMLFLVGLELQPRMLWNMRHKLIGLGGLQVGLTTLIVMLAGISLGFSWKPSLVVGLIFSLSSTAIVLQTLAEKSLDKTDGGRASFSVLLFQDIAVIPMLALIPLLATPELFTSNAIQAQSAHAELSLVAHLTGWQYAAVMIGSVVAVIVAGQYFSHPLFKWVAKSGLREVFTATTLLIVIGIAALMSLVGLSPALGVFIAGMVLANSEFRHELESNIQPFKGLLLGLFFITVGAGISFEIIKNNLATVLSLSIAVITLKAVVLFGLAIIFKVRKSDGWLMALSLAQAGEFGFVVLAFAKQNQALSPEWAAILSPVVAISMIITPLLFLFFDKVIVNKYRETAPTPKETSSINKQGKVIIAGAGRFGQVINRLLMINGFNTIVLDQSVSIIERIKRINMESFFGDATQSDLLHTAGIESASLLVIAIDDKEHVLDMVKHIKHQYPKLPVVARAYDRGHAYALESAGANYVFIESYHSALEMAKTSLNALGFTAESSEAAKNHYLAIEKQHHPDLLNAWKASKDASHLFDNYLELYMQLEAAFTERDNGVDKNKHQSVKPV
ncbi:monovalent cation:proton antiporter-2 (CPA2) family protein [Shewanella eurypsychrophilus]|uniref:Monovalent cation:proton antiporter-2 (CPA2) family protein n=1 Tax=Shewanella eurypsychrophilus TaxID=2593656 RepID=A0ABX6V6V3_9GAMM|nr:MULTISPECIES: monovalent cation:proton antiporter-2 (CPA2) family protein [Shewanella]QFU23051.1 potassium transporter [Shewanella sp. YLB-09]QPG58334.1 monovalent cation:proton antiporter-2 (CPA2) family protein [Shewanella eurypsychrophilus]